ncbi:hypothetical protein H7849_20555 [Alloacidobacterium dinghuense]|uniref:Uncharacterized protein n=1 Tax=Alloacidobacterium dinghuense TaxID=2763107 RepID=A0A7G8BFX2_9BACT|nr:hypothetical protein [Alloacidobacterium dinghuense]QNI31442.1 hypothetical protein H7849_20555 [Alloacidobacterium dinghuense]
MKEMKNAWILTAVLALAVCPIAGRAQDASSAPATTDSAPEKKIDMVGARASLSKGIDAKKAKQGDAVTAKLQDDVKIPDSVDLPKNTVLLGRIDQVQPSENKGDSSVQVTFDKAQLKNGQQLAIKVTIMQIAPPPSAMRNQESASAAGGTPSMPSSPAPSAPSGSGGGMQPAQSQPAPSMAPSASDSSQPQPAQQGIAGVQLQSDIHQSDSGVFTAKKKNVHLDDGTQLQMAIAVIPPNTQLK